MLAGSRKMELKYAVIADMRLFEQKSFVLLANLEWNHL